MAVLNAVPAPIQNPIVRSAREHFRILKEKDPQEGLLTDPWIQYFTQQGQVLEQAPSRIKSVALTAQAASISATDMSDATLSAGLYQIQYYARITRAATTSSSLEVTFDWTDGGVVPSQTGAAITGNTTTSIQTGALLILIDSKSPVRYSTTYASVGATAMQYTLRIILSEVLA